MPKIAVILSGCGVYDGSEIHEATATLLALDEAGAEVVVAAPAGPQMHVVDHQAGQPAAGESRDIRVESARIARGPVADIASLRPEEFDAVVLPGGFGAAKNLSSFAGEGAACDVESGVAAFLRGMHDLGRPIGALCIAPVILARVFGPAARVRLTIGDDPATADQIEKMGAEHVPAAVDSVVVDEAHKLVTTPAYMKAERISEVFAGARALVDKLISLC